MRFLRALSLVLVLSMAAPAGSAQLERWTVETGALLNIEDLTVLDDGAVLVALAAKEGEHKTWSCLLRYRPGNDQPARLAEMTGFDIKRIEALEGHPPVLLVSGVVGEREVSRLFRLNAGVLDLVRDLDDIERPDEPETSVLTVSQDARYWATYWPTSSPARLHIEVGEVPSHEPKMAIDLDLPGIESKGLTDESFVPDPEWFEEFPCVELLTADQGSPVIAAQWRGGVQIISVTDRSTSPILRPTRDRAFGLYWSPLGQRLWVMGFHRISAFNVTSPSIFSAAEPVSPELELAFADLENTDATAVRDRADGTILVLSSDGRGLLLVPEDPGKPRILDTFDLGPEIIRAKASRSGRFVAGIAGTWEDGHSPDAVVLRTVPFVGE